MGPRSWVLALAAAVIITMNAVVIANFHGPGSPVYVLLINGIVIVGLAGALASLVALGRLWSKRDRS
jgi:hypothetical protein